MRAYVKSPAKDPASIGIAFINAYHKYDKLEETPVNSDPEVKDFELLYDEPEYPKFYMPFCTSGELQTTSSITSCSWFCTLRAS